MDTLLLIIILSRLEFPSPPPTSNPSIIFLPRKIIHLDRADPAENSLRYRRIILILIIFRSTLTLRRSRPKMRRPRRPSSVTQPRHRTIIILLLLLPPPPPVTPSSPTPGHLILLLLRRAWGLRGQAECLHRHLTRDLSRHPEPQEIPTIIITFKMPERH